MQQLQLQMEAEMRYMRDELHNNNRDVKSSAASHKLPPTPLSPKGAILAKALHSPREKIDAKWNGLMGWIKAGIQIVQKWAGIGNDVTESYIQGQQRHL